MVSWEWAFVSIWIREESREDSGVPVDLKIIKIHGLFTSKI